MRELKRTGDLRAIRTRENIENAFLELLSQKELPNIRVKEICDIARVSRVTFYDHYKDVYYLMDQISRFSAESLCNLLLKKLDGEDTAMEHFSLVYDKIIVSKGAQRIYPLPTNYEYYLLSSTRILNSLLEADAKKYNFPLTDTLPYITEFISFGLIGIYKKWYASKRPTPFWDELTRYLVRILPTFWREYLQQNQLSASDDPN